MTYLLVPLLTASMAAPLSGALLVQQASTSEGARRTAVIALSTSCVLAAEALREAVSAGGVMVGESWSGFAVDGLGAALMFLFSALALAGVMVAPRHHQQQRILIATLLSVGGTLAAYCTRNLLLFFLAWTVPLVPFLIGTAASQKQKSLFRSTLFASIVLLGVGVAIHAVTVMNAGNGQPFSMSSLATSSGNRWVFWAFIAAAILRTGVFPAHRGIVAFIGGQLDQDDAWDTKALTLVNTKTLSLTEAPLLPILLLNGHLGLYLLARLVIPVFRNTAADWFPLLCGLALLSSLYLAVRGLAEKRPERILATVFVSQSCGLFAGLLAVNPEGVAGALLQWIVLAICSTVLVAVLAALQSRTDGSAGKDGFQGLAARAPRLAVLFAVSGLALTGLPGTLGFAGEDLLMHGALAARGWLGAALPIAIAFNAWHLFRLFTRLFFGEPRVSFRTVQDALPRERWSLSLCMAMLIWLGLMPAHAVSIHAPAVHAILETASVARVSGH
jgi:NADH-quinone oxidoreductase subunit M